MQKNCIFTTHKFMHFEYYCVSSYLLFWYRQGLCIKLHKEKYIFWERNNIFINTLHKLANSTCWVILLSFKVFKFNYNKCYRNSDSKTLCRKWIFQSIYIWEEIASSLWCLSKIYLILFMIYFNTMYKIFHWYTAEFDQVHFSKYCYRNIKYIITDISINLYRGMSFLNSLWIFV